MSTCQVLATPFSCQVGRHMTRWHQCCMHSLGAILEWWRCLCGGLYWLQMKFPWTWWVCSQDRDYIFRSFFFWQQLSTSGKLWEIPIPPASGRWSVLGCSERFVFWANVKERSNTTPKSSTVPKGERSQVCLKELGEDINSKPTDLPLSHKGGHFSTVVVASNWASFFLNDQRHVRHVFEGTPYKAA